MCTTYLMLEILKKLQWDLIGYPKLVRLNPNIPWKTRGNGAITFQLGKGIGKKFQIAEIEKEKYFSFENGKNEWYPNLISIIKDLVENFSSLNHKNTNPGIVFCKDKIDKNFYYNAVRKIVSINESKKWADEYILFKNGRGIIGATAAIAWPSKNRTFELINYLPEDKWSDDRFIDEKSVIEMDKKIKTTFDNYDYEEKHITIKPNSKTPVLYGIRGTSVSDLFKAHKIIKSNIGKGFLIFETNQATDDHLCKKEMKDIEPYTSVIVKGMVSKNPEIMEGGHVLFNIKDDTSTIDCIAYEPTKSFREYVKLLKEGDEIEVYGGVRDAPLTINLEKFRILKLKEHRKKKNPSCPKCNKTMESMGLNKGYRCKKCKTKKGPETAEYIIKERFLKEGFYEVPVCARRHLAKPLSIHG